MLGVGGDLKDHLVPAACHGQGCHPLDQVAQGLEHPQGWGICSLLLVSRWAAAPLCDQESGARGSSKILSTSPCLPALQVVVTLPWCS